MENIMCERKKSPGNNMGSLAAAGSSASQQTMPATHPGKPLLANWPWGVWWCQRFLPLEELKISLGNFYGLFF